MSYTKTNWQNTPSTATPLSAENLNKMERGIADAVAGVDALQGLNYAPIPVTLVADMTDHDKIYVYLGSETGYQNGHWYYWDGSAWTEGGGYNSLALVTDKTLTIADDAADAKATGDAIEMVKDTLDYKFTTPVLTYESGAINAQGYKTANDARIRIGNYNMIQMRDGDFVDFGDTFEGKMVYFTAPVIDAAFFDSADANFASKAYFPKAKEGLFVSFLIRSKADPSADISSYVSNMNNYVSAYLHSSIKDDVSDLGEINQYYGTKNNMEYAMGNIEANGNIDTTNMTKIVGFVHKQIKRGDVFDCDSRYKYKYAIYNADTYDSSHFVIAPLAGLPYASGKLVVDDGYEGYYIAFLFQKVGSESSDIRTELRLIADHTKYYNFSVAFNNSPLSGKKLSLLGASISAYSGYIPEGNRPFYNGSNYGVSDPSQMWWWQLCSKTGMERLVINAWSGSGITQLTGDHTDRVPMSDDSRCKALDANGNDPDIILIIGGTNDWTYAAGNANLPLAWDGKTAPVLTNSFTEALAVTVKKVQETYPNAMVVLCSTVFCQRDTDNGYTYTHEVNGVKYTLQDYDEAIKFVADAMRIPYLNCNKIGFNRFNYYPTYCVDSSVNPTHPNALGHSKIGQYMADRLTEIIGSWYK